MLEIGSLVDSKYKILDIIGRGGMSVVYLAINESVNKQWAIKEVLKDGNQDIEIVKMGLLVEINLLKELRHPGLPSIVDIIENSETLLIVMDYIEGNTLEYVLKEQGILSQKLVVSWAKQLCEVLIYLHTRTPPIIYRDMKPANIMLKPDGKIVLIDFGIARKFKKDSSTDTICLGTRGYAPPEQFKGSGQKQTDPRSDIYCLGATLYHLLTGHNPCDPPFEMYPIKKWRKSLSDGLEKIILKCTQENPENRYQTCEELLYALEHYNEIEDRYLRVLKKKLWLFTIFTGTSLLFFLTGVIGLLGINYEQNKQYNHYLYKASSYAATDVSQRGNHTDVVFAYQQAIAIAPQRSEAYLQLLDYYMRIGDGQLENGLILLSALIASNKKEDSISEEIFMKIGKLYFNGSTNDLTFTKNYSNAYYYFSKVQFLNYPEIKYYIDLSKALSSLEVDWPKILNTIEEFKQGNRKIDAEARAGLHLTIANIYRSQAAILKDYIDAPFDSAISELLAAKKIMENPYEEAGIKELYYGDVIFGLADSCYRKANLLQHIPPSAGEEYYREAIAYYREFLSFIYDEESMILYENRIADIFRALKDYESAAAGYEELITKYPHDVTAYASYGLMALVEMSDEDRAFEIYELGKNLNAAQQNPNFQALKQKLKLAGKI